MALKTGSRVLIFMASLLTVLPSFAQPSTDVHASAKPFYLTANQIQTPREEFNGLLPTPKTELARGKICPHDHEQLYVPSGAFTMGSTKKEREYAYGLDKEVTRHLALYLA